MSDEALDRLAQSFVRRWRGGESPTIEEYAEGLGVMREELAKLGLAEGLPAWDR